MDWRRSPLFVFFLLGAAPVMLVPCIAAYMDGDHDTARPFFYGTILTVFFALSLGLALMNRTPRSTARSHLLALMGTYILLPIWLAVPLAILVPTLTPVVAYFEMVSALTTTGATVFDRPGRIPDAVHIYRGLVGWAGGFLILVAAVGIMAPLNIGGFEIRSVVLGARPGDGRIRVGSAEATDRILRAVGVVAPIYGGLTALLGALLLVAGEAPLDAFMGAMAVIATSGITATGAATGAGSIPAEMAMALFLLIAATALIYDPYRRREFGIWRSDPELRVLVALVIGLPTILFLRHWVGALELEQTVGGFYIAMAALWGAIFTTISFVTTFGQQSVAWDTAQAWSGLPTPGLLLMGLAMLGGGVATTAGGVKLLRVYALYKHGTRELRRLTLPHSIGGQGQAARRIRTEGAYIAWLFLMLFFVALAALLLLLTLTGLAFDQALPLATAALSNTGPGYELFAAQPRRYLDLGPAVHLILSFAMILGRLETLAFVALLNPEFWRR